MESGVTGYAYDLNSNLTVRADARGRQSTRTYDALNRVTGISYYDNGATPATPTVTYSYTGSNHTSDFLTSVSSSASTYGYSGYDALGRPGASQQTTTVGTYTYSGSFTGITWTPQGDMKSITYPSGRTITTSFDNADRPVTVAGSLAGGATTYYTPAGVQYTAHSGISQLSTGEGVTRSIGYNSRLQVSSLVAVQGASTLLSIGHSYGVSSSQNNGSPSGETIARPGGFSVSQSYGYDGANRLVSASENSGWNQSYVFDAVGNRAVNSGYIPATTLTPQTMGSTVPYDGRNHWVAAGYDAAGNMTSVSTQTMTYDAEGRLLTLTDSPTVSDSFTYDGDGRRVTKTSSSGLTTYVYDPNGQLAMEVSGAVGCHDYLPFGEEIPAVSGWGRNTVSCYAQTPETDVKFTGQLFDAETGLAYFNARYLRASMGAYISADEPLNDQGADDPQSWKLDSYVRNNPLAYSDPSGMTTCDSTGNHCFDSVNIGNGSAGYLGWDWFFQHFQYLQDSIDSTLQAAQQTAAVVQQYINAPRNQNCVNAYAAGGSVIGAAAGAQIVAPIGAAAGAAGGTFALPVGGTIAGGAGGYVAGGVAGGIAGGAVGTAAGAGVGWLMCSTSNTAPGGGGASGSDNKPPVKATKLKGSQGWRDEDGNIWKKDMLHKDHWDVSNRAGRKIKEVDFNGRELWPNGPKNAAAR